MFGDVRRSGRRGDRCPPETAQRDKEYFQTKTDDLQRADRHDRSRRSSPQLDQDAAREEIRDIVDEIISLKNVGDVDLRAGGHCSRTSATTFSAMVRSSRCWRATTSPTSWSTAPTAPSSKSRGKVQLTNIRFRDNAQLMNICQRIVSQVGRRVDESSPICDARLPDGSPRQRHRAAARHRRRRAHDPEVQEGQADARSSW